MNGKYVGKVVGGLGIEAVPTNPAGETFAECKSYFTNQLIKSLCIPMVWAQEFVYSETLREFVAIGRRV